MARARGRPADRRQYHHHRLRLAASLIRFLHITRRRIPHHQLADYQVLWHELRDAATTAGARAWIFHASAAPELFIEFIEWQSAAADAIIERAGVAAARRRLDAAFPFEESETWKEARL